MTTKLLAPAGPLLLAVTVAGCARPGGADPPPVAPAAGAASSTTAAPATTADPAVSGWPTFTSVAGGYRLRHPPGWRVKESTGSGGPVLSLLPPRGAGINILVISTRPPRAVPPRTPAAGRSRSAGWPGAAAWTRSPWWSPPPSRARTAGTC